MGYCGSARLLHYAYGPILAVHDMEQDSDFKPKGLWVSVEDGHGWFEWCEAESFAGGWTHVFEVHLRPDANVLHLSSALDIDTFHAEYTDGAGPVWYRYPNWARVAEKYDGLIIAPYQWERRTVGEAHNWYYSWDCSSGCIWRARAVASIGECERVPA